MHAPESLNEAALARECLHRIGEESGALGNAARVLDRISRTDGLGEVLRDFARQTSVQLHDLIHAARRAADGACAPDDAEILARAHLVVKTAAQVLDMAPAAMARNKADSVGGSAEKMPRAAVAQAAHDFTQSPDVRRLLASEDAGQMLAAQRSAGDGPSMLASAEAVSLASLTAHHGPR